MKRAVSLLPLAFTLLTLVSGAQAGETPRVGTRTETVTGEDEIPEAPITRERAEALVAKSCDVEEPRIVTRTLAIRTRPAPPAELIYCFETCGTGGCDTFIFEPTARGLLVFRGRFFGSEPVVKKESTRGYRDIEFGYNAGATDRGRTVLRFDGKLYR